MSEAVYNRLQLGRQTLDGTAVAATSVFGADAGFLGFELDRAHEEPDEDWGTKSLHQPTRGSYGLRGADASLPFACRFQDIFHMLEMHTKGGVSPTGVGPYVYVYTADETSDTLKRYTVEAGDINSTQDEWRATGVLANTLELGYDALSAPGNPMWRGTAGLMALDWQPNAMTGALSAPTTLENMEGQYTTLLHGTTATAFASLSEETSVLKSFRFTSDNKLVRRAYGGTTDIASGYGHSGKPEASFEALVKITAGTKSGIYDHWNVGTAFPTERRWRISVDGSGNNLMVLDGRVRFTSGPVGDHEGERLYSVKGVYVYDATLAGRYAITLTNDIASVA